MTMTGWEVLSDTVKIGLPSLLTGVTAFFIARGAREHELDKERRRRKQDFLERMGEALDNLEVHLSDLQISAFQAHPFIEDTEETKQYHAYRKACEEACRAFSNLETRLMMLGFSECVQQYEAFIKSINGVYDQVARYENHMPAEIGSALDASQTEGKRLRNSLAGAYRTL